MSKRPDELDKPPQLSPEKRAAIKEAWEAKSGYIFTHTGERTEKMPITINIRDNAALRDIINEIFWGYCDLLYRQGTLEALNRRVLKGRIVVGMATIFRPLNKDNRERLRDLKSAEKPIKTEIDKVYEDLEKYTKSSLKKLTHAITEDFEKKGFDFDELQSPRQLFSTVLLGKIIRHAIDIFDEELLMDVQVHGGPRGGAKIQR